jgi:hypothetical protein
MLNLKESNQMLAIRLEDPGISQAQRLRVVCAVVFLLIGFAPCTTPAAAAKTSARGPRAAIERAALQAVGKSAQSQKPAAGTQSTPEQATAKAPDWPVNDKPKEASVVWNSKGLSIEAANSSLEQILNDVATATGAKVSGMTTDQRVFGTFGPGPARDVLSKLLDGSGYNVLMVGDMGQGAPRQIVLSKPPTGPAPPVVNSPPSAYEDSNADIEEPQPPPQPLVQPQNAPEGPAPPNQPRTPQQILQEMQRRQQLIEQMQQQQRNNPQNQ